MGRLLAVINILVIATLACYWSSQADSVQDENLVLIANASTMIDCVKKSIAEGIEVERLVFCSKNSSCYTYNTDPAPEMFNRHPDCKCFVMAVSYHLHIIQVIPLCMNRYPSASYTLYHSPPLIY